jgi:glutaredoxin
VKSALALVLALLPIPVYAGVYKWTDEAGRAHYSDLPPPTAGATRLKLQSHAGPVQVTAAPGAGGGVTLFTTEWCGACRRAKAFLRENRIPFSEWDVEKSDYGAAKFAQLGGRGVPLITVGARKMLGFDPGRFMQLWQAEKSQP